MKLVVAFACCVAAQAVLGAVVQAPVGDDEDLYKLPKGILIGGGVSATQAEGATHEGGKVESVVDKIFHTSSHYKENNDVSADHYHRYKEDLKLAKQLKLTSHRFSISWSRIFPTADMATTNPEGVQFYHDYIDEIRQNNIEPLVTMYHFDHPWSLEQSTGGWTNRSMVDKFVTYATFLFKEYGSKIKYWNPINEGNMYCIYVQLELNLANLTTVDNVETFYKCTHNTVLATAKTYRLYKKDFYAAQQGKVGTSVLIWPTVPKTLKYEDQMAADTFNEVFAGIIVHPLVHGEYPHAARYLIDKRSKEQGLLESRLPTFSDAERKELFSDGPATDFVALNVYNTFSVQYGKGPGAGSLPFLEPVIFDIPFVEVLSGGGFADVDPDMMKTAMLWAWKNYHLPLVITETGYGDSSGEGLHDSSRIKYMSACLRSLAYTSNKFDIPVISVHMWALLDIYEFTFGLTGRPFGAIHVDYEGKTLNRTIKDSGSFFIEMMESGHVPDDTGLSSSTAIPSSTAISSSTSSQGSTTTTHRPSTSATTRKPNRNGSQGLSLAPAALLAVLCALVI